MSTKVAINGLRRIGRAILKLVIERPELELVAVNDLAEIENLPPTTARSCLRVTRREYLPPAPPTKARRR